MHPIKIYLAMTTVRNGLEHRPPRLSQHPIKTDEIEVLESAGGDDQQDKVQIFTK